MTFPVQSLAQTSFLDFLIAVVIAAGFAMLCWFSLVGLVDLINAGALHGSALIALGSMSEAVTGQSDHKRLAGLRCVSTVLLTGLILAVHERAPCLKSLGNQPSAQPSPSAETQLRGSLANGRLHG